MKAKHLFALALVGGVAYWLSRRPAPVVATGVSGGFLESLTGVLAGTNTVKTQSKLNVDTSGMTIGAIAVGGASLVAAAYFLGAGRRKPKRRRKARRR